ncbi:glycosyl transferase family 90 [Paracoccus methylarcula]|uniref:Glycosyl transferase CAP10 domain-containing protein n=1 Tax=Paracoccus methylarcula TaxID=72022 RepID=A0A422QXJ7_9RHOB|nr:glycosyl transferase family 90 [Paracoccus methylarcula]RNF34640.1 hypothetical protein A7A09_009460 [Paracoccus methylarcula]
MPRKFFQIGFNKCGTTFIARLFDMNNIPAVHWLEGDLAEDIAYSKLVGRPPLQRWAADTVAFTDMESVRYLNMPVVEAFREYAFLDQSFPGSVFLLNTRRVEDWIISRYMHRGGSYARAYAQILGVSVGDLADIWKEDWDAHLSGCRAYFGSRPEFIEIDIDEATPEDYRAALSPWFDLPHCPTLPGKKVRQKRASYLPKLERMLTTSDPGAAIPEKRREAVAKELARFARPARLGFESVGFRACSGLLVRFDAAKGEIRDRDNQLLPIRRGAGGRYHADPAFSEIRPVISTVNDIAEVTDDGVYHLDMRRACLAGSTDEKAVAHPIIAPSRRSGAENVFLWPMPWQHRLGSDGLPGMPLRKEAPFAEKLDRAIWRGGLSGYALGEDGPDLARPVRDAIEAVLGARDNSSSYINGLISLRDSSRIAFVAAHADSADVDARFTPDAHSEKALRKAGLDSLVTSKADDDFLFSHRYIIALGGSAGTEDFLVAANSQSVVLKEEDGWKLFHSSLFRPWEHYVPLQWAAADLEEKLDWARSNPDACQAMSDAARKLCEALADPAGRRMHLERVLSDYRSAMGQAGQGESGRT